MTALGFVCEPPATTQSIDPQFYTDATPWSDSLIQILSLDEKIGQLFMIPAYTNGQHLNQTELIQLIDSFKVGGIIFMQGGPLRQAHLHNAIQNQSKIPLMVAMDAEWGLGMRLDSTIAYPRQMAMSATRNPELVKEFGIEAARQLKRIGVNISFSPVVDVNNNKNNPVINARSFGEEVNLVTEMSLMYMHGLQENGVMACAKHFPGHGDTDVDSHKDLPLISHNRARLDSVELFPFRKLVDEGLASAMVAHLLIPALDSTANLPSTLSHPIVTGLLKEEMGFDGLIFTDALTMKGAVKHHKSGEIEVKALEAGNDVLLFPTDLATAVNAIKDAVDSGRLTDSLITVKCHNILKAKEWFGLNENALVDPTNLYEDLNDDQATSLHHRIAEEALTVVKNESVIPINLHSNQKIAILNIGTNAENAFTKRLADYVEFDAFKISATPSYSASKTLVEKLSSYDLIIANFLNTSIRASKNYGIHQQSVRVINSLSQTTNVVANVFSNPYSLGKLQSPFTSQGIVVAFHDDEVAQEAVADAMVGAIELGGKLPVTASPNIRFGLGGHTDKTEILRSTSPLRSGVKKQCLNRIDSIVYEGINAQAFPGCRVLAAKGGEIFFDKSYGHFTYEQKTPVDENTLYDVASITKMVSTTMALMHLQDQGKFDVDYNLCDYLPIEDTTDYFNMNCRDILSHYAKLQSWIPFYLGTIDNGNLDPALYRNSSQKGFNTQVADDLYILDSYVDTIYSRIMDADLREKLEYKYSDLGYYFMKQIIENISSSPLKEYVDKNLYQQLGIQSTGYLPLERWPVERIAPTEYDLIFRKQLIQGHVHDPGAAMMGGVGGHAGIFSTAGDLGRIMQMLIDEGRYAGQQILTPETIDYYTDCHYCSEDNRRGIGFDKSTSALNEGPSSNGTSAQSFGHSGFTGTLVWADPTHDIVYVFLSNRVYPNAENKKLLNMDIRTRIQQVIYDAFEIPDRPVPASVAKN